MCGQPNPRVAGVVEYFKGYAWTVHDCEACGSRFTAHDTSVYNVFHQAGSISYYRDYRDLAERCKTLFDAGDRDGLRAFLSETPKYRFVIDSVASAPATASLLEIGCSRGYLTSMLVLDGRNVLGVDVSAEAVDAAARAFGDHFALHDSERVARAAPFDVIYHVGMIGCVADPVGLTQQLLGLLKPGGVLLFNAPNRDACSRPGQLWIDSAPPPDLVTLFGPGFFRTKFAEVAHVTETVQMLDRRASLRIALEQWSGVRWRPPTPRPIEESATLADDAVPAHGSGWRLFERIVGKLAAVTGLMRFVSCKPSEFGLYVQMKRKAGGA